MNNFRKRTGRHLCKMASLKEQKEAFVSGHEGTTPAEILIVCLSGVAGYWLYSVWPNNAIRPLTTEASLFWLPMVLVQSRFLYPWGVLYLVVEVVAAAILEVQRTRTKKRPISSPRPDSSSVSLTDLNQQHGALTMHRCIVMYLTFVAILAVDFPLFPRRFAKTETAGYSLMDVGAASFALLAGLSSPRARHGRPRSWKREIWRMLPLVFMGSLRLLTHQEIEYQEHVSEYGVHWNFFYTLAVLGPLTALLPGPTWILPIVLMLVYQYFLSNVGLQEMIEEAPRKCLQEESSFLCHLYMANREGLLGCIGYVSIYLIGEWIGSRVLWIKISENVIQQLSQTSMWIAILWRVVVVLGIPVSRRSTNLGFVLWTLVVNLPFLTLILLIYQRHQRVTFLARLVNRHGLVCFIVANLLTGIVNLSINTLETGDYTAIGILLAYLTALGIFVMLLEGLLEYLRKPKQS